MAICHRDHDAERVHLITASSRLYVPRGLRKREARKMAQAYASLRNPLINFWTTDEIHMFLRYTFPADPDPNSLMIRGLFSGSLTISGPPPQQ